MNENQNQKETTELNEAKGCRIQQLVLQLEEMRCPFCGESEIYVHTPNPFKGRVWWTIGCESISCDSSWSVNTRTGDKAVDMFERSRKFKENAGLSGGACDDATL